MSSQLFNKSGGWSERFSEKNSARVQRYTSSVQFDKRLAHYDIQGSLAHAEMLAAQNIITAHDYQAIKQGLNQIEAEIRSGDFHWDIAQEEVHLNIESRLITLIGDAGKRLHTGRSRNDQIATDIRLYLRAAIDDIDIALQYLQTNLLALAEQEMTTIMPGFTHLQVAQPVYFSHHLLAYVEMFARDRERLTDCRTRVNRLPLGAAALAGTSYPIDRKRVANTLGFADVCHNSLDAVSDRDFAIEFCALAALAMVHFSRLSEELILWMSPGFGFVELADRFCTGSSIMPQKKNPDVAELARGKTGRTIGAVVSLLTLMKGQPLAYNKDNQEDKEPLFDAADTLLDTALIFAEMFAPAAAGQSAGVTVHRDKMANMALQGYATATDVADYLVKKGLNFRDAHGIVAAVVRHCIDHRCDIASVSLAVLQTFSPLIAGDIFEVIRLSGSVASRTHIGATGDVKAALARWREILPPLPHP